MLMETTRCLTISGIIYKEEKCVYANVRVRREILTEPDKIQNLFCICERVEWPSMQLAHVYLDISYALAVVFLLLRYQILRSS